MVAIRYTHDPDIIMAENMLIQNDMDYPNILRDNVLYYISGFMVCSLLTKIQCANCRAELLLDAVSFTSTVILSNFLPDLQLSNRGGSDIPIQCSLENSIGYRNYIQKKSFGQNMGINNEKKS